MFRVCLVQDVAAVVVFLSAALLALTQLACVVAKFCYLVDDGDGIDDDDGGGGDDNDDDDDEDDDDDDDDDGVMMMVMIGDDSVDVENHQRHSIISQGGHLAHFVDS